MVISQELRLLKDLEKSCKVKLLDKKSSLKTILMVAFILFFIVMMIRAIVGAYNLTPTSTAEDLQGLPLWEIPLVYIWDYAQHGWVCLGFAFTVSGCLQSSFPRVSCSNT